MLGEEAQAQSAQPLMRVLWCARAFCARRAEAFKNGYAMRMTVFSLVVLMALSAFGVMTSLGAAEIVCKGLANDACAGNNGCSWVKPHKIKSGKEIAGFCRKKPTRSPTEKAPDKS